MYVYIMTKHHMYVYVYMYHSICVYILLYVHMSYMSVSGTCVCRLTSIRALTGTPLYDPDTEISTS